MRCTKCHYLSFEPEARCRNCGHDLSIDDLGMPDLPLTPQDADDDPLADFDLAETAIAGLGSRAAVMAPPRSSAATAIALTPMRPITSELPLFVREMPDADAADEDDDDAAPDPTPLVRVPARPRAPISVRRTTPDPARLRARYTPSAVHERDLLDEAETAADLPRIAVAPAPRISEPAPARIPAAWFPPVAAGVRLKAAAIDAGFLGTIAAVVAFCTFRQANVAMGDFGLGAAVPLGVFFLLISAGYFLLFIAVTGQTVGKMAMRIRVVGASSDAVTGGRVTLSQAAIRAVAVLPSVLVLGAGFVPALLRPGLAVHDRIAHTRVIRL